MSNEVEIVVKGTNRAKGAFSDVEKDASKMETTLKRVSKGMGELDRHAQGLTRRITSLREEFHRTGDVKLLPHIDEELKRLKQVEQQIGKFSPKVADVQAPKILSSKKSELFKEGQDAGGTIGNGIMSRLMNLPPQAWAGIAAGAAVVAPAISGVLSAAVLAGVGGGVLAGGIFLAAKDSRVKEAWGYVGETAGEGLSKASGVFIKPLIDSADAFGRSFSGKILPALAKDFQLTAPLVKDVTDGLIGLAERAMPGIDAGVKGALPVLRQFAAELPGIGSSFTKMMQDFERSSGGAVEGMKLLGGAVRGTFESVGFLVSNANFELAGFAALLHGDVSTALTNAAAAGSQFNTQALQLILQNLGPVGQQTGLFVDLLGQIGEKAGVAGNAGTTMGQALGTALAKAGEEANKTKIEADSLKLSWQQLFDTLSGNRSTMLDMNQLTLDAAQKVKDHGASLSTTTQSGIENNKMIDQGVGIIARWRQENDNGRTSSAYLNSEVERQAKAFEDSMVAAGFNRNAVHDLIAIQLQIPTAVSTRYNDPGLAEQYARANGYKFLTESLNGKVVATTFISNYVSRYTTVTGGTISENQGSVSAVGGGRQIAKAHGGIAGAATGGARGNWTMVGEQGRELVKLAPGSTVVPNGQTESMMASGGGGAPVQLTLAAGAGFGSDFERVLLGFVLKAIQLDNSGIRSAIRDVAAAA